MEWVAAIATALSVAQKAYELGKDILPIIEKIYDILTKGEDVTKEELQELQDMSDSLSAEIQKPIPPEEA